MACYIDDILYVEVREDEIYMFHVDDGGVTTALHASAKISEIESLRDFKGISWVSSPYYCVSCERDFWSWDSVLDHFESDDDDDDDGGYSYPTLSPAWQ